MTTTTNKHPLINLALSCENDLSLRSYAGRGMFGRTCLGIDGNVREVLASLMAAALEEGRDLGDNEKYEIIDAFSHVTFDQMGRSEIVYFPTVAYDREDEQANAQDDE